MTWTLGVDFGTSNTAAAYRVDGGRAQSVRLSDQAEQMPSAILALDTGILVGGAAVRSARLDPQRFEPSPKRRLGEGEILLGPREWPVTQLIAEVLGNVKQKAIWVAGGEQPQSLILTYPQQWARGRKDLLRQAAAQAGFDPATVRLVTEPIAAATWYASTQPVPPGKCVAVFDFGGGTCDVAVLRSNPEEPGTFIVLAAEGIDPLGGELLDLRLLEWTLAQLATGGNAAMVDALSAPENLAAMLTLKEQVRHAKHELAEYESARIPVAVGQIQTVVTITIAEFDRIVGAEIDSAMQLTRRTLVASGVLPTDLHALYLTGGSSHLRLVHRRMTELLGRPPATLNDPKLVVSQGALLVPPSSLEQPGAAGLPSVGPVMPVPPAMPVPPGYNGPPSGQVPMPIPVGQGPASAGLVARTVSGPAQPPAGPPGLPVPFPPPPGYPGRGPSYAGEQPRPGFGAPQFPQAGPMGQGPLPPRFNPPPPGGPPAFGQPASMPPRGRPKWLIPALAAAVAVIVAAVVIFVSTRGSGTDTPAGPTASTGVSTSSTTNTEASAGTSTLVQYCNGTTIAVGDTCATTEPSTPLTCWDASTPADGQACPVIAGQAGLEWVFPVPDGWKRTCAAFTDKTQYEKGEEEVFKCSVEQLPDAVFYLSRWTDSAAGKTALTARYGAPVDWSLQDVTGSVGSSWTTDQPSSDGTGKTGVRIDLYQDHPFSLLALFVDAEGAGKDTQAKWDSGQLFVDPDTIKARGGP